MVPYPGGPGDADHDVPLDPAASVALIRAQRARVAAATDVDARLLFGVWGAAWLVGFGALYAVAGDDPLLRWRAAAGIVFATLIAAAIAVTAVHVARRTAGVLGTSATQGAMYGWAWFAGFAAIGSLGYALARVGATESVYTVTMTVVPALVVGVLYMAGGAIWQDRTQFVLGSWVVVVTIAAAAVGPPHMLAVMALAGGGGMLAGAFADGVRMRRDLTRPAAP